MQLRVVLSVPVLLSFLTARKSRGALVGPLLLCLSIFPAALFGEGTKQEGDRAKPLAADFVLTIQDGLLSVTAKKASLTQLLGEIGRRMNIEVVAEIPAEDKVTLAFDRLTLKEALQRFSNYTNLAYFEREPGQISKIMAFPKGATTGLSRRAATESELKQEPSKGAPRTEPFKFEFDPSKHEKRRP
jgi:hypothetical protein